MSDVGLDTATSTRASWTPHDDETSSQPAASPRDESPAPSPSAPPAPIVDQRGITDAAARQQLINDLKQQQALVNAAEAKANATGNLELKQRADALRSEYDALEKSKLAADAYHFDNLQNTSPPVGWTRASSLSDAELAKYGVTRAMLDPGPTATGFRAELYIPDKSVFGPDAKPVLAFRGSTSDLRDWRNNFTQATGQPSEYYQRAMDVAMRVNTATGGNFEITGHSLGGGLASAASAVTGAHAVTFNAAGLNPATIAPMLAAKGISAADTDKTITAYQVQGEMLTSLQQAAHGMSPSGAQDLADGVKGIVDLTNQPVVESLLKSKGVDLGDLSQLKNANGQDLRSIPEAAGQHITLPAYGDDGTPRPQVVPFGTLVNGLDTTLRTATPFVRGGVAVGNVFGDAAQNTINGVGQTAAFGLRGSGTIMQGIAAGGNAANDALDRAGAQVSSSANQLGNGVTQTFDRAGNSLHNTPVIGGALDWMTSTAGKTFGGAIDLGGKAVDKTLDFGGDVLHGLTGWMHPAGQALDNAGNKVSSTTTNVAQGAHDLSVDAGALGGILAGGTAADARAVASNLSVRDVLLGGPIYAGGKAQADVVRDLGAAKRGLDEAVTRHGGPRQGADGRLYLGTVDGSLRHAISLDEQYVRANVH